MTRRLILTLVATTVLLLPRSAHAIGLGVDVGGGSWLFTGLQLDAHLRVDQELLEVLKIGVRPGIAYTLTQPVGRVSLPLDATLRLTLGFFYLEALGGLYWTPSYANPLAWHAGGGLGVQIWKFSVGVEASYLQPTFNVLGRVAFTFF